MKNRDIKSCLAVVFTLLLMASPLLAQEQKESLAANLPSKALVYLESQNLSGQLGQLLDSGFSAKFSKTQAYKDFTVSKLFNKLGDRIKGLEEATEFGFNLKNLRTLAGDLSALALYDIGELKFVFITRVDQQKVVASSLWGLRDKFETRKATAIAQDYWVKEENGGRVTFAFTFHNGYLVAGTDVVNFEKTLELMGKEGENLLKNARFAGALQPVKKAEDLLLYLDMKAIQATPYWKSYWVYGNQDELKSIDTAAITLKIAAGELKESRFFSLDSADTKANSNFTGLAEILPAGMGYYDFGTAGGTENIRLLEAMFSGSSSKLVAALYNSFQAAEPVRYATALKLDAGIQFDSFKFSKVLVLDLAAPEKFVSSEFEKNYAALYEDRLLYGESGLLKFKDSSNGRVLDVPLLKDIKTGYSLKGNHLVIFQGFEQLPAAGKNPLMDLAAGDEKISSFWLNFAEGTGKIKGYFDLLAKRKNWSSTNNAKFFDISYSSLLDSLNGIKMVISSSSMKGNVLEEELRYILVP